MIHGEHASPGSPSFHGLNDLMGARGTLAGATLNPKAKIEWNRRWTPIIADQSCCKDRRGP
jgi:hypothetical protein